MSFTSYDAATHTIERAKGLLRASQPRRWSRSKTAKKLKLVSRPSTVPPDVRSDMRRLSIVMAVAALDTYMHRLILERAFKHDELPKQLAQLDVSFKQLLSQADATKVAARAKPKNTRPRVAVKRQLQDRLLFETFQNFNSVSQALAMAGRKKEWKSIGAKMSPSIEPDEIKERLNAVVHRRNQIVHEGDYKRLQKPQRAKLNPISQAQARSDLAFIAALIDAIHDVVS